MSKTQDKLEKLKLVGMPKGSVLWPSAASAVLLGILGMYLPSREGFFVSIFLAIFTLNALILFFDFARGTVMAVFGLGVAAFTIVFTQDINIPFQAFFRSGFFGASPAFLILFGIIILINMGASYFAKSLFDYYEISSNTLIEKSGVLGDSNRYNAPDLSISKEIVDVFESLILFGAGNLRIRTNSGRDIIIENIPRIGRVEESIREILGRIEVDTN